jgi:predicted NBD/HSP70 family sugar kinase
VFSYVYAVAETSSTRRSATQRLLLGKIDATWRKPAGRKVIVTTKGTPERARPEGVLNALMNRQVTSIEFAAKAGLSLEGAARTIETLRKAGWLRPASAKPALPEEKAAYEFVAAAGLVFGVDVGGTKVHAALADMTGTLLAEVLEPTNERGGIDLVNQIAALYRTLLTRAAPEVPILQVATIGLPGAIHPRTGEITMLPNIAGMFGIDFRRELESRLGFKVVLENDVNLAAFGEHRLGHGRGIDSLVFVALGTGIGMGIVNEGRLVRGARGGAGEISTLPIGTDPFDPRTFASGALESAISSEAIRNRYGILAGEPGLSVRDIFAEPREANAFAVIDEIARILAVAIAAVSAILDPEAVVFGGSIGVQSELVSRVEQHLRRCCGSPPRCIISEIGNAAGLHGAIEKGREQLQAAILVEADLDQGAFLGG